MGQQRGAGPAQPFHYLAAWGCREDWQGTCYELVQSEDSDSIPSGPRVVALGIGLSYATVQESFEEGSPSLL